MVAAKESLEPMTDQNWSQKLALFSFKETSGLENYDVPCYDGKLE